MPQGPYPREYGVATTVNFVLFDTDGVDFKTDAVYASGDVKIMKDEGAEANITTGFTDEGQGYSIPLSATEMQAARIVLYVVDQGTKAWLDDSIIIETYNHPSSQYGMAANVLVSTSIAVLNDQDDFELADGSSDDDAYSNPACLVIVTDQSSNVQKAVLLCISYTGASKNIITAGTPAFTIAANDRVDVIAPPAQLPNALAASSGGLVTGDADNFIAGIQGTVNDLDGTITATARAILPQTNTTFSNIEFLMVDSTDHETPKTGLSVSGEKSIDGGGFAAVTGSIAEVSDGIYQFDASAADMNGTVITFRFSASGADDRFIQVKTAA